MKFNEFKNKIEAEFSKRFNASQCHCRIFQCIGKSITIDFVLANDRTEAANGIYDNDAMYTSFIIHMPDSWNENEEIPEEVTMEILRGNLRIKPANKIYWCDYRKIPYRKTKGNAEKMVKAFIRYIDRLQTAIREEYKAQNLLDRDMELIKQKRYAA